MLCSSTSPTNWASCILVLAVGCTRVVSVAVVSITPGLEITSWAYSLATRTAHSFLSLAVRLSYVLSACFLEWPKAAARETLRASEVSLLKN